MAKERSNLFPYNPKALTTVFKSKDAVCDCCGKKTDMVYEGPSYYNECDEYPELCPECVASGAAHEKFGCSFVSYFSRKVVDKDAIYRLSYCTPPYFAWQEPYFPSCCGDFCAFIDDVGVEDLEEMGIYDEVVNSYEEDGGDPYDVAHIEAVGSPAGYLFRCRHCGKYHLHIDYD